ncbi:hypothetical protein N7495_002890 [Penicillium taxi]|uniref:uncharacterized protein n=1 Tax=Penicillium taxi TaxID=168475 RepID=UPI002544DDFA|nr:uncharacterized protein N7495_002890 [Penicillium taxi]KAJ5902362.1 hypothetical protein N7495_002890 [Penicillium taxi]
MAATSHLLPGIGLVIGSATGIGKSVSFAFARAGVSGLFMADINEKDMTATANDIRQEIPELKIVTHRVDIGDEASCIDCVQTAVKTFGRIDYVLNNVGIGATNTPTHEQTGAHLATVLNINFVGLWNCHREQIKQMLTQEILQLPNGRGNRGVITNTASIMGLVGAPPGHSPYSASKHAIIGLTKTEAATYSKEGIRINSVCPGYCSTAILGEKGSQSRTELEAGVVTLVPMGRLGETDEIADSVVFLSSHMASYITGSSLVVDGGYTAV